MRNAACIAAFLLLAFGATGQNTIVGWETYFDTDQGPGTGIWYPVTANDTVSILDQLDVSALSTGFHHLFVRMKASTGLWSSPRASLVYVQPAIPSPVFYEIVACEYFVGVDPGVGSGTPIPLDSATSELYLERELDLLSLGLDTGDYHINIRFKSSSGHWSMIERRPFSVCNTWGALAGFDIYRSGSSVSFVDQSQYATSMFYDFGDGQTDTVWNPYHTYSGPGNYTVTQVASNACAIDTVVEVAHLSGLSAYQPIEGSNAGYCTISMAGVNFSSAMSFRLFKSGSPDILPDTLFFFSEGSAACQLNLFEKETGIWNIEVVLPGDTVITLLNAFTIVPAPENILPITAQLIGPPRLRSNRWATYSVQVHNPNPNDVFGVALWVAYSSDLDVNFQTQIVPNVFPGSDTLASVLTMDSLFGRPFNGNVRALLIALVPAGGTIPIEVSVRSNLSVGTSELLTWTHPPLFGFRNDTTGFMAEQVRSFGLAQAYGCISCFTSLLPGGVYIACFKSFAEALAKPFIDQANNGGAPSPAMDYMPTFLAFVKNCGVAALQTAFPELAVWGVLRKMRPYVISECVFRNCVLPIIPPPNPIPVGGPIDPNDKYGPHGVAQQSYVARDRLITYMISFENVDTSLFAAQRVIVIDTLDMSVLNLSDARLGEISLGDSILSLPIGQTSIASVIDIGNGYELRVNAELDTATHVVCWDIFMADTTTHQLPLDPSAGFLPPNVVSPQGQGFVSLRLPMRNGLPHEQTIVNQATIIFDNNEPISTDAWLNTIDALSPTSGVNPLSSFSLDTNITISWHGDDANSGVAYYEVYASSDTTAGYELWTVTGDTTGVFIGEDGVTYHFYSIGVDSVGNREVKAATSEAQTQIDFVSTDVDLVTDEMVLGLFPNPTTGQVTLRGHTGSGCTLRLEVRNALGQSLLSKSFATGPGLIRTTVDVSSLAPGAYVVALTCNDAKMVERLIRASE